MRNASLRIGTVLLLVTGAALVGLQLLWFFRWWNLPGLLLGVLLSPLALFFPLLLVAREGFSLTLFTLAAGALLCLIFVKLSIDE